MGVLRSVLILLFVFLFGDLVYFGFNMSGRQIQTTTYRWMETSREKTSSSSSSASKSDWGPNMATISCAKSIASWSLSVWPCRGFIVAEKNLTAFSTHITNWSVYPPYGICSLWMTSSSFCLMTQPMWQPWVTIGCLVNDLRTAARVEHVWPITSPNLFLLCTHLIALWKGMRLDRIPADSKRSLKWGDHNLCSHTICIQIWNYVCNTCGTVCYTKWRTMHSY